MIKNSLRVANRQGVQRIANLSWKMSRQFAILNKPILEFCLHIICKNVNIIFKLYMDIFSEAQCGFGVEYIRRVARSQRESWSIQVFVIYTYHWGLQIPSCCNMPYKYLILPCNSQKKWSSKYFWSFWHMHICRILRSHRHKDLHTYTGLPALGTSLMMLRWKTILIRTEKRSFLYFYIIIF